MTISQIYNFYILAKTGNFTRTSQQLHITQPTLSKSISSLEDELKVRLIDRTTRNVKLTPAGECFLQSCEKILEEYQSGVDRARTAAGLLKGNISFGLPSEQYQPQAIRLLRKIHDKYPGIKTLLHFFPGSGLLRAADHGGVDFAIASGRARNDKLSYLPLCHREGVAVLPSDHPLANRTQLSFSELRYEDIITMSYKTSSAEFDAIVGLGIQCGFSPHVVHEATTISELLMLVAAGRGVSVLKDNYRAATGNQVVFIPLKEHFSLDECLIWQDRGTQLQKLVIELAGELIAEDSQASLE